MFSFLRSYNMPFPIFFLSLSACLCCREIRDISSSFSKLCSIGVRFQRAKGKRRRQEFLMSRKYNLLRIFSGGPL